MANSAENWQCPKEAARASLCWEAQLQLPASLAPVEVFDAEPDDRRE